MSCFSYGARDWSWEMVTQSRNQEHSLAMLALDRPYLHNSALATPIAACGMSVSQFSHPYNRTQIISVSHWSAALPVVCLLLQRDQTVYFLRKAHQETSSSLNLKDIRKVNIFGSPLYPSAKSTHSCNLL